MSSLRSLSRRQTVTVDLHPAELSHLIRWLEDSATQAADDPDQEAFADYLVQRAATLREATR